MNPVPACWALLAAALFAVTSVLQHRAATAAERSPIGDPRLLARLLRNPVWLLGGLTDAGGVLSQGAALRAGALAFVQPLLVSGLLLAVPLEARSARRPLPRGLLAAVALSTAGLAAFLAGARPGGGVTRPTDRAAWLVGSTVAASVLGCLLAARVAPRRSGVWLGVATGVLYAVSAALLKVAAEHVPSDIGGLLRDWTGYGFVLIGGLGMTLNQNAFQTGVLAGPLTALTLVEPLVSLVIGVAAFHEHIDLGAPGRQLLCLGGVVAMAVGVWRVSARAPAPLGGSVAVTRGPRSAAAR
jgi:hypothetical protein